MAFDVLTTYPAADVAVGQTLTFPYPADKSAASYLPVGAAMSANGSVLLQLDGSFSVSLNATGIVVTLLAGAAIRALTTVRLQAVLSDPAIPLTINGTATTLDAAVAGSPLGLVVPRARVWRNALAHVKRNDSDALFVVNSDSTGAGSGSVGGSFATWANNGWPAQIVPMLKAAGLPVIASNICGAHAYGNNADPNLTLTGAFNGTTSYGTLGGNAFTAQATGTLAFTSRTGDAVDVCDVIYVNDNGSMSLNIDGGTATTVTGTGSFAPAKITLTAGSVGTHTINASWISGRCAIIAIIWRSSTQKAIIPINASVHGTASSYHASTGSFSPLAVLNFLRPHLNIISIGINDVGGGIATSATQANIQTMITSMSAYSSVMLLTPPPVKVTTSYTLARQQALNLAYYKLVAANPSAVLADLYERWGGDQSLQNALGQMYDDVHPNQYGYNDIATFASGVVANP